MLPDERSISATELLRRIGHTANQPDWKAFRLLFAFISGLAAWRLIRNFVNDFNAETPRRKDASGKCKNGALDRHHPCALMRETGLRDKQRLVR